MIRKGFILGALIGLCTPVTGAWAQDRTTDLPCAQAAEAERAYARGVELRRVQQDAPAVAAFEEAFAACAWARALAQIGWAYQAQARWMDVAEVMRRVLLSEDAWLAEHPPGTALSYREIVRESLTTAESHLGRLRITGPVGTELEIDGEGLGSLPIADVWLEPGNHELVARAEERESYSVTVPVVASQQSMVLIPTLALLPTAQPEAAAVDGVDVNTQPDPADPRDVAEAAPQRPTQAMLPARPPEPSRTGSRLLFSSSGLVLGGSLVSFGLMLSAHAKFQDDAECFDTVGMSRREHCPGVYDRRQRSLIGAASLLGVGVALAVAGIVVRARRPAASENESDGVAFGCSATGCGLRF